MQTMSGAGRMEGDGGIAGELARGWTGEVVQMWGRWGERMSERGGWRMDGGWCAVW